MVQIQPRATCAGNIVRDLDFALTNPDFSKFRGSDFALIPRNSMKNQHLITNFHLTISSFYEKIIKKTKLLRFMD